MEIEKDIIRLRKRVNALRIKRDNARSNLNEAIEDLKDANRHRMSLWHSDLKTRGRLVAKMILLDRFTYKKAGKTVGISASRARSVMFTWIRVEEKYHISDECNYDLREMRARGQEYFT